MGIVTVAFALTPERKGEGAVEDAYTWFFGSITELVIEGILCVIVALCCLLFCMCPILIPIVAFGGTALILLFVMCLPCLIVCVPASIGLGYLAWVIWQLKDFKD